MINIVITMHILWELAVLMNSLGPLNGICRDLKPVKEAQPYFLFKSRGLWSPLLLCSSCSFKRVPDWSSLGLCSIKLSTTPIHMGDSKGSVCCVVVVHDEGKRPNEPDTTEFISAIATRNNAV
ncbi:hypothetical protein Tco_0491900 [Tanacetum coccineum]